MAPLPLLHPVCVHVSVCACNLNLLSRAKVDLCLQYNTLAAALKKRQS